MVTPIPVSMVGRTPRGEPVSSGDGVFLEDMVFIINVLAVALANGFFLAKVITACEYEFVDVPVAWVIKLGVSFLERVSLCGAWR